MIFRITIKYSAGCAMINLLLQLLDMKHNMILNLVIIGHIYLLAGELNLILFIYHVTTLLHNYEGEF